ncbi:MAG: hypothetical protein WCL07_00935 [bacterium]
MSKIESLPEPDNSGAFEQILPQLIAKSLSSHNPFRHIDLVESHLRHSHIISPEEQFEDYFIRMLRLGDSLKLEALDGIVDEFPAPVDVGDFDQVLQVADQLSLPEENELRISELQEYVTKDNSSSEETKSNLELQREYSELIEAILLRTDVAVCDDTQTQDPEQILRDSTQLSELIHNSIFEIITIDGQKCWSIYALDVNDSSLIGQISALRTPDLSKRFVVTDPERNSELTTRLFSSPALLKQIFTQHITETQHLLRYSLIQELIELDGYIDGASVEQSHNINFSLQKKLLLLMKRDVEAHHDLELVIQNHEDESEKIFRIGMDKNGDLLFSQPNKRIVYEPDPDAPPPKSKWQGPARRRKIIDSQDIYRLTTKKGGFQYKYYSVPDTQNFGEMYLESHSGIAPEQFINSIHICSPEDLVYGWGSENLPRDIVDLYTSLQYQNSSTQFVKTINSSRMGTDTTFLLRHRMSSQHDVLPQLK